MNSDDRGGGRKRVIGFVAGLSLVLLVAAGMIAGAAFFLVTNPFSRVGEVGYVYEEPRFFGRGGYLGTLEGTGSFGGSFKRQEVVNISVLPEMFAEEFDVRAGSQVARVSCEVTLRVDPAGVKRIVEEFGAAEWYRASVRAPVLRSLRATLSEGLSGDRNISFPMLETVIVSALEGGLEQRRVPVWVDGVFLRRIEWIGEPEPEPEKEVLPKTGDQAAEGEDKPEEAVVSEPVVPKKKSDPHAFKPIPDTVALPGEIPPTLIEVSHRRELRGLWLATVANVDWPSRAGLPPEEQKEELIAYLDIMADLNMNALVLQVRPSSDAFYRSKLEPWSRWLSGEPGVDPGYDPLEIAIEEGRKRGIEVHAWFNPYRALMNKAEDIPEGHIAKTYPEHAKTYGRYLWMDPGARPVQEWIVRVINDVVTRYDIAGVHFDDYFYPYPLPGAKFDDTATYLAYVDCCGPMELHEWRRHNIHTLVHRLSGEIHAIKPHIKFGISPFGLYRPGEPEGTKGLDQVEQIFSDPKKWLDEGWVDYVTPQLYWKEESKLRYSELLDWWGGANSLRRHIYAGNALHRIEESKHRWPVAEMVTQVNASRVDVVKERQSLGNIFFGAKVLKGTKGPAVQEMFKKTIYPNPALPPVMGWLEDTPEPPRARRVEAAGNEIHWESPGRGIERWTLYRRDEEDNGWKLFKVIPAELLRALVPPGTYAISAVDPMMREGIGVVVEVGEPREPVAARDLPPRPQFEKGFGSDDKEQPDGGPEKQEKSTDGEKGNETE